MSLTGHLRFCQSGAKSLQTGGAGAGKQLSVAALSSGNHLRSTGIASGRSTCLPGDDPAAGSSSRLVSTTAPAVGGGLGGASAEDAEYSRLLDQLDALPYPDLQRRARDLGISAAGRKSVLAEKIADAMLQLQKQPRQPEADDLGPLDGSSLRAELGNMPTEQLASALGNMGKSTEGSRAELVERLASIMEADMAMGQVGASAGQQGSSGYLYQQEGDSDADADGRRSPSPGSADGAQNPLGINLRGTGLANCGVLMTEENTDYDTITSLSMTQIRKLKVSEARIACKILKLSEDGNRYELSERLIQSIANLKAKQNRLMPVVGRPPRVREESAAYPGATTRQVQPASPPADPASISGMGLRALRAELARRELPSTGSRSALEARLAKALAAEANEEAQEEAEAQRALLESMQTPPVLRPVSAEVRLIRSDPPLTVTVLFGAPGGTLEDLQASLDAARCVAAHLQTSWDPESLTARCAAAESQGEGGSEPPSSISTQGVVVRLLHVTGVGAQAGAVEWSGEALMGVGAAELVAGAHSLHTGADSALEALALHTGAPAVASAVAGTLVFPVISTAALNPASRAALASMLAEVAPGAAAGAAVVGGAATPAAAASAVVNKLTLQQELSRHGFPSLPSWRMLPADLSNREAWIEQLRTWVDKRGYHPERQMFVVKPAVGSGAVGVTPARGVEAAAEAATQLLQAQLAAAPPAPVAPSSSGKGGRGSRSPSPAPPAEGLGVVIEPYMGSAMHVSVTVIEGPDGRPLSLMPAEREVSDTEEDIEDSFNAVKEWQLMQEGNTPEEVAEQMAAHRAAGQALTPSQLALTHRREQPFTRVVHHHSPPRLSAKLTHALRHGAALAFTRLGLKGAARFDGWVELTPGWQDKYDDVDDGTGRALPDQDPLILAQVKQAVDKEDSLAGPPMSSYYDYLGEKGTLGADLTRFDPKVRLTASGNQEGTVYFTDVNLDLELDPAGPVFREAAEVGLSQSALLRTLVNSALRRSSTTGGQSSTSGGARGRGKSQSPSPEAAAAPSTVQLAAPPPIDPMELAAAQHAKPVDFEVLEAITVWRTERWVKDHEEQADREVEARETMALAVLLDEALAPSTTTEAEPAPAPAPAGKKGRRPSSERVTSLSKPSDLSPFNFASPGDVQAANAPPSAADNSEPEDDGTGEGFAGAPLVRDKDSSDDMRALRDRYPGLPESDLMYVVLGQGPDGREIDTLKLEALCAARLERAEAGDHEEMESLGIGLLEQCLIDPETGEVGRPSLKLYGTEGEPGGMLAGTHRVAPEVAARVLEHEASYANGRTVIKKGGNPPPRKVWLLLGGDGEVADESLRAGRAVAQALAQYQDVQVELMLVMPSNVGRNESSTRAALLARRTEWLVTGLREEDMPDSMSLEVLRNSEPSFSTPQSELVMTLTPAAALQFSAEAAYTAAERLLHRMTTADHALPPLERQALDVQLEVQRELAAGGVQGVAGLWGGEPDELPVPPRCVSLAQLGTMAAADDAVVIPLMRGWLGASGLIAQVLQDAGAQYSGSGPLACMQCGDKLALAQAVGQMGEDSGVLPLPNQMIAAGALIEAGDDESFAEALLEQLRLVVIPGLEEEEDDEGEESQEGQRQQEQQQRRELPPLRIRPSDSVSGVGVAQLWTGRDLARYGAALGSEAPAIPANSLSYAPHGPIKMPRHAPSFFVVEPLIECDRVVVTPSSRPAAPPAVAVTPAHGPGTGWFEVVIGLQGDIGTMEPLGMSLLSHLDSSAAALLQPPAPVTVPTTTVEAQAVAAAKAAEEEAAKEAAGGKGKQKQSSKKENSSSSSSSSSSTAASQPVLPVPLYLTPPPEDVLPPDVVERALMGARDLVDRLALQGLVRVDGYVSKESGDLIISDVDTSPALTPDSPLFQQAMRYPERPMGPASLIRSLISQGLSADRTQVSDLGSGSSGAEVDGGFDLDESSRQDLDEFGVPLGDDEDDLFDEGGEGDQVAAAVEEEEEEDARLDDLEALQASGRVVGGSGRPGGGGDDPFYLSSSGRPARRSSRAPRGRPASSGRGQGGYLDTDEEAGVVHGDDWDIDGMSGGIDLDTGLGGGAGSSRGRGRPGAGDREGPNDDLDFRDNWAL